MSDVIVHHVGGGTGINLKVVGGTTQPSSPKENTVWVNTSTTITSWDFSATQPARRSNNKNLLVYPYTSGASLTSGGVVYTCNSSGHVTANGTATSSTSYYRALRDEPLWLDPGTYTLSGCPAQPSGGVAYQLYVYDSIAGATIARDQGAGATFTLNAGTEVSISIQTISGKTATNAVFKPQLEKGSTATSFVKGDATGQVWFSTGASSTAPMNIDKKNTVMLYPVACKQYVGGAWVRKPAQTSLNGAWADWMLVLWDSGDNEAATGGWTSQYFNSSGSADYSGGSVSVSSGTVTLSTENTGAIAGQSYTTIDAIDMTPYETMKIYITDGADNGYGYTSTAFFGVTTARTGTAQWTGKKAGTSITPSIAKEQSFVLVDISNVNEPCYILTAIEKGGGAVETSCSISFNKIELY